VTTRTFVKIRPEPPIPPLVTLRYPGDVDIPLTGLDMRRAASAWAEGGERPMWLHGFIVDRTVREGAEVVLVLRWDPKRPN
jgi:hypothetical protein